MGRSKQTNGIHKNNHKDETMEKMHHMLGDLRKSIFKVQEERSHSEHTLSNITKTHEHVVQDNKSSTHFKLLFNSLKNLLCFSYLSSKQCQLIYVKS